jgi:hypothetical protein
MTEDLPLTAEDVAEIVAILESSGYREVDIATNRFRLRVARGDGAQSGFTQEWQWAGATGAGGRTGEAAGAKATRTPSSRRCPARSTTRRNRARRRSSSRATA